MALPVAGAAVRAAVGLSGGMTAIAGAAGSRSAADLLGSVPDWVSLSFTIADQLRSDEGFRYNIHTFKFTRKAASSPESTVEPSPSMTIKRGGKTEVSRLDTPDADGGGKSHPLFLGRKAILSVEAENDIIFGNARVLFHLNLYTIHSSGAVIGFVSLGKRTGFDTKIGHQLAVEFAGVEHDAGYILAANGWVDRLGSGYANFGGRWAIGSDGDVECFDHSLVGEAALEHKAVAKLLENRLLRIQI